MIRNMIYWVNMIIIMNLIIIARDFLDSARSI